VHRKRIRKSNRWENTTAPGYLKEKHINDSWKFEFSQPNFLAWGNKIWTEIFVLEGSSGVSKKMEGNSSWLREIFLGAVKRHPSSNNGLKSTNSVIKAEHTMWERLPVGKFIFSVLQIVSEWSETRNPESANCIEYATTPKVSLLEWTIEYQWAVKKMTVIEKVKGIFYQASSTSKTQITTCWGSTKRRNGEPSTSLSSRIMESGKLWFRMI